MSLLLRLEIELAGAVRGDYSELLLEYCRHVYSKHHTTLLDSFASPCDPLLNSSLHIKAFEDEIYRHQAPEKFMPRFWFARLLGRAIRFVPAKHSPIDLEFHLECPLLFTGM